MKGLCNVSFECEQKLPIRKKKVKCQVDFFNHKVINRYGLKIKKREKINIPLTVKNRSG